MSLQNTQVCVHTRMRVSSCGNCGNREWEGQITSRTLTSCLACHWPHWRHVSLAAHSTIPPAIPISPPSDLSHIKALIQSPLFSILRFAESEKRTEWEKNIQHIQNDVRIGQKRVPVRNNGRRILNSYKNSRDLEAEKRRTWMYMEY